MDAAVGDTDYTFMSKGNEKKAISCLKFFCNRLILINFFLQISENFQKVDSITNSKPTYSWQNSAKKSFQRPVKRQRFSGGVATAIDDEASSDSDKDLTPYYSSSMALASSTEEKKRRDSRSKRFEKVQGHSRGNDIPKPKNANVGNLHSRRDTALRLSRDLDESGSRAVEDIDWDALTVKGTCQEIEKRYLRLTSAPDPSTVNITILYLVLFSTP